MATKKKLHKELRFDSLSAIADYIESNRSAHNRSKNGYDNNPYADQNTKFKGGTYSECMHKLRNGDIDLLNEYVGVQGEVVVPHTCENTQYDVQGAFVDVGAYVSGAPECMVSFVQEDSNKFAEVVMNISYSSATSHKAMFDKYIYVVKLIDMLESSGTRCKVIAMCASEGATKKPHRPNGNTLDIYVDIKHYQDALPLAHLLFVCCNPMFLRIANNTLQHIHLDEIGYEYAGCCFGNDKKRPACDAYIQSMYTDTWIYKGTTEDFMKWVVSNGING